MGRPCTCKCGTCEVCRHRAAIQRWKARHPERYKAGMERQNSKRSEARRNARVANPEPPASDRTARKGSYRNLDEVALKWLQDRGFR